ncbi:hypothetical protein ADL22_11085 [Streptomyces sp. NRRL F-4489]|uniref:hypothetical protein n=1 Tax=Streptomyces sp. NRRL F-4489 TaxID=1609095 RepID=UPI000746F8CB|nr:hypothetical protein [Streptomyces sp. NRRL F-4489]KUL46050.1 hypothetical protein ADL22_11085 [Streptomyces sp. NRRL F-4489]
MTIPPRYPPRSVTGDEFDAWARMIADTYGADRTAATRALVETVYEQARAVTVGWPDRQAAHWRVRLAEHDRSRGTAGTPRCAVHQEHDGRATGYALYRHRTDPDPLGGSARVLEVLELAALSRHAYAALWRYLAGIDLVAWIEYEGAPDCPPSPPRAWSRRPAPARWPWRPPRSAMSGSRGIRAAGRSPLY